ncbi:transporter [Methylobacterium sp. Leaf125]|jgi:predicted PurR-regulated permease PerM|uniref:AI-2E family transporter n=1 Tax=unclassified Methylobacterium TaxID=2615210 RepID=UPI0006F4E00A|nr:MULTISPECIES: AI-2E family transporter [unclassified Methylobacterium]KQQ34770.1 transporter [Methylobacterium sp. Leaf125]POR40118.1 AI-2E family transporter [Methylobacterium sp. V23]
MSDDPITARLLRQAMPVFTTLASCLLVITIAAALYLGRDIFVPVTLAILLSFVLVPGVRLLRRIRVPRALAVLAVVLTAFGALLGVSVLIANEAAQLASDLPRYQVTMREKIASLKEATAGSGTLSRMVDMVQDLGAELQPDPNATPPEGSAGSVAHPLHVQIASAKAGLIGTLGAVAGPILHPLATTGLILIFTIFILLQREDLRNRAIRLAGSGDLRRTTAAIDDAVARLSRFFLAQLVLNIAFGLVIGLGLWVIGVPNPILFGVLAAIMRFVPYIGAAISALLPLIVAAAVDPGWSMVIATAALFLVVEPIAGHVVEPLLYGHSTGLSPIAVILAATLWAFLWGPIGLVLATPITVCLVVLGRHIERLWYLDVILGDRPALSPPEIFYQRMLAGDPEEAIDQGRMFLKARALVTYYDEVVLAGLLMAQEDLSRGTLDRIRQDQVGTALRTVVARLGTMPVGRKIGSSGSAGNSETSAAIAAIGPDRQVAAVVLRPDDLPARWRAARPVLCVSSRGPFDEAATAMLGQILGRHGLGAQVMSMAELRRGETPDDLSGIALVCFSYLEPVSLSQIRLNVRQARRAIPGVRVLVGFWRERDPASLDRLRRTLSADVLVTTLNGALDAALTFAKRG